MTAYIGLVVAARNAHLDDIHTRMNAGAGPALLRIYDGTRPATGGAATTLVAELTFSDPAAASGASNGLLTFSAITKDSSANANGSPATWCRIVDSTAAFVMDGNVGTSAADFVLNTTTITAGVEVSCTSAALTAGNS